MNIGKIQEKVISPQALAADCTPPKKLGYQINQASCDNVSFTGGSTQLAQKGWFVLKKLANAMKNITEYHNAIIAAIGTGIIAPLIILVSPGKGDKEDKDKKFFQAIRQPISAILQLSFQVPATILVNRAIDKKIYGKKPAKFFQDNVLGNLIPEDKYLKRQITKEEIAAKGAIFEQEINGKTLKQELIDKIKKEYEEVGLTISDDKVARRAQRKRIKNNFIKDKIVSERSKEAFEKKVEEFMGKNVPINELDLVTEGYKDLAKERFKEAYTTLEKDAKLNIWDKIVRTMGFETKNTKALKNAQDEFTKIHGLKLFNQDNPNLVEGSREKLEKFLKVAKEESMKTLAGKRFWISLIVNLFMFTASCYALNWIHPRVKELIDTIRDKKAEQNPNVEQKVEVK